MDPADADLLTRFARARDSQAFAALVARHVDWLYAAAARMTRDPALAEDVVQGVFCALAAKADAIPRGRPLAAWLFRAAHYGGAVARRAERRRKEHERMTPPAPPPPDPHAQAAWREIEAKLDDAVGQLPAADREAIVLRFYQRLSYPEIAGALRISEDAARKRTDRALVRLRAALHLRRDPRTPALANALAAAPLLVAPPHLHTLALTPATPTAALVSKGVLAMSVSTKTKLIVAAAAVALATGAVGTYWRTAPPAPEPARAATAPAPPAVPVADALADLPIPDLTGVRTLRAGTNAVPTYFDIARGSLTRDVRPHGAYITYNDLQNTWTFKEGARAALRRPVSPAGMTGEDLLRLRASVPRIGIPFRSPSRDATFDGEFFEAYRMSNTDPGGMTLVAWVDRFGRYRRGEWTYNSGRDPDPTVNTVDYNITPANIPWPDTSTLTPVDPAAQLAAALPPETAVYKQDHFGQTLTIHNLQQTEDGTFFMICTTRVIPAAGLSEEALTSTPMLSVNCVEAAAGGRVRVSTAFSVANVGHFSVPGATVLLIAVVPADPATRQVPILCDVFATGTQRPPAGEQLSLQHVPITFTAPATRVPLSTATDAFFAFATAFDGPVFVSLPAFTLKPNGRSFTERTLRTADYTPEDFRKAVEHHLADRRGMLPGPRPTP